MSPIVWILIGVVDVLVVAAILDAIEHRITPWWRRKRGQR